ncbi:UNVERIFIED_CONTAM: two-component system chemotaxis response regulator CheB [Acetivibrio alkalicellulosi]
MDTKTTSLRRKIKVLIVDDSIVFREGLARGISSDSAIEVVATAPDPYVARDKIIEHNPDVMTLDVEMPKMNGIEFLKRLMPQYPIPVVVVSSISENVFDALNAGAVDFVTKPNLKEHRGLESFINELVIKIKIASTAKVGHWKKDISKIQLLNEGNTISSNKVIAIGASTGGTEAIASIISSFSKDMPGIVVVQHMPPVFTKMYADRLNNSCFMEVKEAKDGDKVSSGTVLIAPGDYQMKLKKSGDVYYVECKKGEKVSGHCPSVDVLFTSVADTARKNAIGVILTGMGSDGAKGLLLMKKNGARTIGQDQKSSVVYGMPKVAYEIEAVEKQVSLEKIPQAILSMIK